MKLLPGTEVTPNVRLEREIASGAMGSVWLAEHLTLSTKVAVKFISDRIDSDDPEVMERFVREASTAAQIKSSHVVRTFDQGVMRDGVPYIVMEYLEGQGLGERLQNGGTLPIDQVQQVVLQTAKALAGAHKLGIVHRDIKPDNIFLSTHDDELHIKVFDFGIAKHRRDASQSNFTFDSKGTESTQPELGLTNDGVMIGTPEFMSPEQVMSASSVDHHADLWGLTVVAYACLSGTLPFTGSDVGELCVNLLEATFQPLSKHRPDLPPTLDVFFAKALARNPADRFQSARELSQAFQQAIPVMSYPGGVPAVGPAQMRNSVPSFSDVASVRGMRAATFSGTEADAIRSRRLSPSAIGLLAAGVVSLGIAVAVVFGGNEAGEETTDDENSAAVTTSSTPPTTAVPPPPAEPVAAPPGTAKSAHSAATSPSFTGPMVPITRPGKRPWPRAQPKPKTKARKPGF